MTIGSLIRVNAPRRPLWVLEIDGRSVAFTRRQLVDFQQFAQRVYEFTQLRPAPPKEEWRWVLNQLRRNPGAMFWLDETYETVPPLWTLVYDRLFKENTE